MKIWSFYDKATGVFSGRTFGAPNDDLLEAHTPTGQVALEGSYDHLAQRVDIPSGKVIDYQPPSPSTEHVWDDAHKRWVLGANAVARRRVMDQIEAIEKNQHRAIREAVLTGNLDRVREIDDSIAKFRQTLKSLK